MKESKVSNRKKLSELLTERNLLNSVNSGESAIEAFASEVSLEAEKSF